jgi:hypothetical protein
MLNDEDGSGVRSSAGSEDQLLGLSKIETIDYRWLLRRGTRSSPQEHRRKEELERKHHAALSSEAIGVAADELAVLKRPAQS